MNNFAENNKINSTTTIAEVCSIEKSKITDLVKTNENGHKDYAECYMFMNAIITQVSEYHGADWSDFTTRDLAKTLYHEYYAIGVEGWVHFCKRLKSGYFGKVYGKFTPAILVDYVNIYYSEWKEQHATINANGSNRFTSQYNSINDAILGLKMLKN